MSPWVKGPEHNWRTIQKSRQDADADIIEEVHGDRSDYLVATLAVVICALGWWWQSALDGWARGLVLTSTGALTLYLTFILCALLMITLVGRFIRNV
jgi:hypothetical protein